MMGKTNIATGDQWTYGYDNLNEMTSAVDKTSSGTVETTVDYTYGPFQERLEKDVTVGTTTTTRFAYDGWKTALDVAGNPASYVGHENWDVWADMDGTNSLENRYLRGDMVDQVFARIDGLGVASWLLTDYQGSIRTVIDNLGTVNDQITYDGLGNATQTNSAEGGRYLQVFWH